MCAPILLQNEFIWIAIRIGNKRILLFLRKLCTKTKNKIGKNNQEFPFQEFCVRFLLCFSDDLCLSTRKWLYSLCMESIKSDTRNRKCRLLIYYKWEMRTMNEFWLRCSKSPDWQHGISLLTVIFEFGVDIVSLFSIIVSFGSFFGFDYILLDIRLCHWGGCGGGLSIVIREILK